LSENRDPSRQYSAGRWGHFGDTCTATGPGVWSRVTEPRRGDPCLEYAANASPAGTPRATKPPTGPTHKEVRRCRPRPLPTRAYPRRGEDDGVRARKRGGGGRAEGLSRTQRWAGLPTVHPAHHASRAPTPPRSREGHCDEVGTVDHFMEIGVGYRGFLQFPGRGRAHGARHHLPTTPLTPNTPRWQPSDSQLARRPSTIGSPPAKWGRSKSGHCC
jgi:hypothetical protein